MGEGSSARVGNDRVYVAVGKDVAQSKSTLLWALDNFDGDFRILHVHQPERIDPTGLLTYDEIRARRELEMENMHEILDAYIRICSQAEVHAEKRFLEMRDIGEGIAELIEQHAVAKLVMGAAADIHYSESMTELKSTKAMFVDLHADPSCQIWFTCRGQLIRKRKEDLNAIDLYFTHPSLPPCSEESNSGSPQTSTNSSEANDDLVMVTYGREESSTSPHFPPYISLDAVRNNEIYNHFEGAMVEAENARRKAFQELMRRLQESEESSMEASRRARAFENLYKEEMRRRRELEEIITEERESFERRNKQKEEALLTSVEQRVSLENQISDSKQMMNELRERIVASERMLEICNKEMHDLEVERDNAIGVVEELLTNQASEASSSQIEGSLSEFSFLEIQRATDNFEPSMKIGEDRYWIIFKGFLHHTQVAVKMLQFDSPHAPSRFQQELDIMTKLRHPNLVTLVGVCPEVWALVYEHLPNGSLEDLLIHHEDRTPLSYQRRIRIASEICSALIFLHTNKPHFFVHGDLRLGNILLDANFAAKLSGLGNGPGRRTNLEPANFPHLDLHYCSTGELSAKSDVYSFGVVLLQLLTGRAVFNFAREMRDAVNGGNTSHVTALLDPVAGEWPVRSVTDLARLAIRCCDVDPNNRPDLGSEVWSMLELLRASHMEVPSSRDTFPEEDAGVPDNFICPISHEIMQEPTVAADGYTYEEEAVRGWLGTGHNTSPMTNLPLSHLNLTPNRALRSIVQEWLSHHPQFSVS